MAYSKVTCTINKLKKKKTNKTHNQQAGQISNRTKLTHSGMFITICKSIKKKTQNNILHFIYIMQIFI